MQSTKNNIRILLIICLVLIIIWFKDALLLATGEESISIFNNISIEEQLSFWQKSGTGRPMPLYITRVIPVLLVSLFKNLVGLDILQLLFYLFCLLSGTLGCYFLARKLFPKQGSNMYLIASTFYLLNLYTMSQVFNRFLYSTLFLWSYLPLFLLLWIRYLKTNSIRNLFLFLASSIIYSLAILAPGHVIALWLSAGIYSSFLFFREKNLKILIFSLFGFISWLVVNLWWLYPYFTLSSTAFADISSWKGNFDSLRGVSKYFKPDQLLTLRHLFYFSEDSKWGAYYNLFRSS